MNQIKIPLGQKIAKLIEESPFKNPLNFHKEIVRRFGDGTVTKAKFSEATSNGDKILNELIKNKVVKDITSTEVRVNPNLDKKENLVRQIAKNDFDKVWGVLQQYREAAIKQRRLYFVLNYRGERKHPDQVLHQIASALKIKFYELTDGTTSEPPAEGPSHAFFPYGPKTKDHAASLYNLYQGLPFKPQRIKIMGRESTIEENEVINGFNCFKFIALERGQVDLIIKHKDGQTERIVLELDKGYNFNSGEPHYFENTSKQVSKIFVICYLRALPS